MSPSANMDTWEADLAIREAGAWKAAAEPTKVARAAKVFLHIKAHNHVRSLAELLRGGGFYYAARRPGMSTVWVQCGRLWYVIFGVEGAEGHSCLGAGLTLFEE